MTVLGGRGTVDFRMYADGIGQLVEGWSKNFASGAVRTSPITLILIVAWLSGCISAPFTAWGSWAGAAVYAVYAAQLAVLFGRVGRFPRWVAVLYPLPLAGFLAVFLRSLVSTFIGRGVPWKGRRVKVGIR